MNKISIQKHVVAAMVVATLSFGAMFAGMPAKAQAQSSSGSAVSMQDMLTQIQELMSIIEGLQKQLQDMQAVEGVDPKEGYRMAKVKKVTVRKFTSVVEGSEVSRDHYRILLNDGTVFGVDRDSNITDEQFALLVRETGFRGSMDKFNQAVKRLVAVSGEKYNMDDIESITAQNTFSSSSSDKLLATVYNIKLDNGNEYFVEHDRKVDRDKKKFEKSVRATGYTGSMSKFIAAIEQLENDFYLMKDVKRVTVRKFAPASSAGGSSYSQYVIVMKDDSKHVVKRPAGMTDEEFVVAVRETGFGGLMTNFNKAAKRLVPVLGNKYTMGDIKSITTSKVKTRANRYTVYTIVLENGNEFNVPHYGSATKFQSAIRATGFSGKMSNFNAAVDVDLSKTEGVSSDDGSADQGDPNNNNGSGNTDPSSNNGSGNTDPSSNNGSGNTDPSSNNGSGNTDPGSNGSSQPTVEKFYIKAIDKVTRRDYYNDNKKTELAYRIYRIVKKDDTVLVVKRMAGTSKNDFIDQLKAKGYYGDLENFQNKVVVRTPTVLGVSISVDPLSQLGSALTSLQSTLNYIRATLK